MIPYLRAPAFSIGSLSLDAQGVLTATGLMIAVFFAHRRARRFGIDVKRLNSFIVATLAGSLIVGHVTDLLCYRFDELVDSSHRILLWHSLGELLCIWDGWRSVGGFFGALLGGLVWRTHRFQVTDWLRFSAYTKIEGYWFVRRERAESILALSDLTLSVFPIAWAFNRAGSALVHDHPGGRASADSWLAVAYPEWSSSASSGFGIIHGSAPRYDLGLLELFFTLVLVAASISMWKRPVRAGTYVCLVGLTYPPARCVLDVLCRNTGVGAAPVYSSLTPAEWGFGTLSLLGATMLLRIWIRPFDRQIAG